MAVFGTASGPYHATESCAPAGADQFLAEFAVEAGLSGCGVCQPPEPEVDTDGPPAAADDIEDEQLLEALDAADTVADLVDEVPELERPSNILWLVGRRGLSHRIAPTQIDEADSEVVDDE